MYAVFSGGTIAYLGDDRTDALETLESKEGATLSQVNTLASLSSAFNTYKETFAEEDEPEDESENDPGDVFNAFRETFAEDESDPLQDASDAMERILQKLDDAGFAESTEEAYNQLKETATDAVVEAKSLGIKSMAVVGKGFVALGDLLTALGEAESQDTEGDAEDESKEPVID